MDSGLRIFMGFCMFFFTSLMGFIPHSSVDGYAKVCSIHMI